MPLNPVAGLRTYISKLRRIALRTRIMMQQQIQRWVAAFGFRQVIKRFLVSVWCLQWERTSETKENPEYLSDEI